MASTRQSTRQVRKRFSIKPQRHSSDQPYSCRVLMDFVRYGESILEQQSFFNSTQETRDVENHFLEGFSSSIAFEAFRGEHGDCGYLLTLQSRIASQHQNCVLANLQLLLLLNATPFLPKVQRAPLRVLWTSSSRHTTSSTSRLASPKVIVDSDFSQLWQNCSRHGCTIFQRKSARRVW